MGRGGGVYSEFKSKLSRRLVVPYYVANFAWYPIWFIVCYSLGWLALYNWAQRDPLNVFLSIFVANTYNFGFSLILTPLWFLPCLFFSELIFLKLYNRFSDKIYSLIGAAFTLSFVGYILGICFPLILGLDISLVVQLFLLVGFIIRKYNFLGKLNSQFCIILLMILLAVYYFNDPISMNSRKYSNIILLYFGGIAGSLLLMKISMILANFSNKIFDFVKDCGKQSLAILILHMPVLDVAYHITTLIDAHNAEVGFRHLPLIFMIPVIICGVMVPVWIAKNFKNKPIIKYFCV